MAHAFRAAVEANNHAGMIATLADDVVFHSPAVYKAYQGKATVAQLLGMVMTIFEDFRYTDEVVTGPTTVLVFEARVGEREVQGVDILRHNEAGQVVDFTVMARPLSGLQALVEGMQARLAGK